MQIAKQMDWQVMLTECMSSFPDFILINILHFFVKFVTKCYYTYALNILLPWG